MTDYHENWEALPDDVKDMHRALTSLKEEIEAVDWYHQRQALCTDKELRQVLIHNRDEEIEHACMSLEWLRRKVPAWDEELRTYLFTDAGITAVEEGSGDGEDDARGSGSRDLGIGDID
ncbi:MAG: ferritin-like domain-containing protein [bacterium]|nr:ferritin-like domain-containing protein [bacterium]